jgi:hypothetical protein
MLCDVSISTRNIEQRGESSAVLAVVVPQLGAAVGAMILKDGKASSRSGRASRRRDARTCRAGS